MPVPIELFGVTGVRSKEIRLRFVGSHSHGEWYHLSDEMEQYLAGIIHPTP